MSSPDPGIVELLDAFGRMRRANSSALEALSRRLGVSATEVRALVYIQADAGATPKLLAEHLSLSPAALTSLLDRLERGGLAERRAHPTDRRSLQLHITETGRAAMDCGAQLYYPAFAAAVPPHEIADAVRIFDAVARELNARAAATDSVEATSSDRLSAAG